MADFEITGLVAMRVFFIFVGSFVWFRNSSHSFGFYIVEAVRVITACQKRESDFATGIFSIADLM